MAWTSVLSVSSGLDIRRSRLEPSLIDTWPVKPASRLSRATGTEPAVAAPMAKQVLRNPRTSSLAILCLLGSGCSVTDSIQSFIPNEDDRDASTWRGDSATSSVDEEIVATDDATTSADNSTTGTDDSTTGTDDSTTGTDDSPTSADDSPTGTDDAETNTDDSSMRTENSGTPTDGTVTITGDAGVSENSSTTGATSSTQTDDSYTTGSDEQTHGHDAGIHSGNSEPSSDGGATGLDGSASENDAGGDGGPIAAATCGNGRVESGEACDDGNAATGDGCDPLCERETISLGWSHSCVIVGSGAVKCWGYGYWGQLGQGNEDDLGHNSADMGANLPAIDLGTGRTAVALASGEDHTCALLDNRAVKCWGHNTWGQLGLDDRDARGDHPDEMGDALPAVNLGSGRSAIAIAAGGYHSCALLDDDSLRCWGSNFTGQLGLGDLYDRGDTPEEMGDALPPVDLGADQGALSVVAGGNHTCALLADYSVKCWGNNSYGQLGQGHTSDRGGNSADMGDELPAVDLGSGRHALTLAAGAIHTCALLDDRSVKCWGYNGRGQLGLGNTDPHGSGPAQMGDSLAAVDFGPGIHARQLTTNGWHTCVILSDASTKCWGDNEMGQLGLGDMLNRGGASGEMGATLPAIDLGTGRSARSISGGANHTCALLDDSSLKCWGSNTRGQLGLGLFFYENRGDYPDHMGDALPPVDVGE